MAHRVNIATFDRIIARQEPRRYGQAYLPSIRATVSEAPSISRPSTIVSVRLGREIHTLSTPETSAALLALMHPGLLDLHEQSMIPRWPAPHPLDGMPGIQTTLMQAFRGSVEVADRLGYLDLVPTVTDRRRGREAAPIVFPYIGDLLLFLRDDIGPYCVNWSVKARDGDHFLPGPEAPLPHSGLDLRRARARYEIEVETYADVEIRTVPVAGDALDPILVANLKRIYPFLCRQVDQPTGAREYIAHTFQRCIDTGAPPSEGVAYLVARGVCDRYHAIREFYVGVFARTLRVNLFRDLLIDYPVQPESTDPIERYRRWFER